MNRIAMPSESKYRDKSPSRIPHFKQMPVDMNKETTKAKRPSRLELLQVDYQKKLMKEKEEKLVQMYEDNQRKALERVNRGNSGSSNRSTPSVREFFQERHKMESKGFYSPPIDQHYRQIRSEMSYPSSGDWSRKGSANSNISIYSKGSSAGRDRSCLLQPIAKSPGMAGGSPIRQIKPRMIQPKQNITSSYRNNNGKVVSPGYSADNRNKDRQTENSGSSSDNSPPPNLANLRNFQRKRLNSQKSAGDVIQVDSGGTEKLTDFQKWQLEQNKAREERLKRHQQINGDADRWGREEEEEGGDGDKENVDIDSDLVRKQDEQNKARVERMKRHQKLNADTARWNKEEEEEEEEEEGSEKADIDKEIARKQQELLDQIERQERELEQLKQERILEEEQVRKNAEKERQRQTIEREKKRKKQEEKRKREEEEEREQQRRQEEEEEQQRRIDEEEERERRMEEKRLSQRRQQKQTIHYEEEEDENSNEISKYSALKPRKQPVRKPPPQRSPSPEEEFNGGGANLDIYLQAAQDSAAHDHPGSLMPCKLCGRKFAADRIAKHQTICRTAQKKRKVFDPVKMRTSGTEMSQYVNRISKDTPKPKKNNWKVKHDSFIESIRYAKKVSQMEATGDFTNIGPPPKADTSDLVPCPHCGRKFNDSVAERHIPRCKTLKTKPVGARR